MTRPGAVRAARPALWRADALLTRPRRSVGNPVHEEYVAIRARPLSMTAVTPSMVIELSATFVERITFGCKAGATARSCSDAGRSPCSGKRIRFDRLASGAQALAAARISAAPGRKTRTSPDCSSRNTRSNASLTCSWRGAEEYAVCSTDRSNSLPAERSTGQASRKCATGAASRVADMTMMRRSGRRRCKRFSNARARSLSRWRS